MAPSFGWVIFDEIGHTIHQSTGKHFWGAPFFDPPPPPAFFEVLFDFAPSSWHGRLGMAFVANMQRAFRARRDENLARRAGTGRNTTKRLFSISLKPFGVRTNRVLDEDKQRPELLAVTEDAAAAESPAPPAESPPPPAESPAPLIDLSEPLPPLESAPPLSSAFEAQPRLPQPPAEESLADGDAEGLSLIHI